MSRHNWPDFLAARLVEDAARVGWASAPETDRHDILAGIGRAVEAAWPMMAGSVSLEYGRRSDGTSRYDRVEPPQSRQSVPLSSAFQPRWLAADGMLNLAAMLVGVPRNELEAAARTFGHQHGTVRVIPRRASLAGVEIVLEMGLEPGRSQR